MAREKFVTDDPHGAADASLCNYIYRAVSEFIHRKQAANRDFERDQVVVYIGRNEMRALGGIEFRDRHLIGLDESRFMGARLIEVNRDSYLALHERECFPGVGS